MPVSTSTTTSSTRDTTAVIDFLDTLREELLNHYSESIVEMRTQDLGLPRTDQVEIDFGEIEK